VRCLRTPGCKDFICLYQGPAGHPELNHVRWFQVQRFDAFRYTKAGVPTLKKCTLGENCLQRFRDRALAKKVNPDGRPYAHIHALGSTYGAQISLGFLPEGLLRIEVTEQTDSLFDWSALMEGAWALVLIPRPV
jgi:hypothetical protein